jgi:hypothetical protein
MILQLKKTYVFIKMQFFNPLTAMKDVEATGEAFSH